MSYNFIFSPGERSAATQSIQRVTDKWLNFGVYLIKNMSTNAYRFVPHVRVCSVTFHHALALFLWMEQAKDVFIVAFSIVISMVLLAGKWWIYGNRFHLSSIVVKCRQKEFSSYYIVLRRLGWTTFRNISSAPVY